MSQLTSAASSNSPSLIYRLFNSGLPPFLKKAKLIKRLPDDFNPIDYNGALTPTDPKLGLLKQFFAESHPSNLKIWKIYQLSRQVTQHDFRETLDSIEIDLEGAVETDALEFNTFLALQGSSSVERLYILLARGEPLSLEAIELAKRGDLAALQEWVAEDPNRLLMKTKEGENLAYAACSGKQFLVLDWLYSQDPNLIEEARKDGKSPLFLAALNGEKELINWFLKKGVSYSPYKFVLDVFRFFPNCPDKQVSQFLKAIDWSLQKRSIGLLSSIASDFFYGLRYYRQGKFSDSIASYEEGLNQWKEIVEIEQIDEETSDKVVSKAKMDMDLAYYEQGEIYLKKEHYSDAIDCFRKSVELKETLYGQYDSRLVDSLSNLILAYLQKKDTDQAGKYLNQLNDLQARLSLEKIDLFLVDNFKNLGFLHLTKGSLDEAINWFLLAVQKGKSDDSKIFYGLGLAYLEKKSSGKAIEFFRKSYSIEVGSGVRDILDVALNQLYLGSAYFEEGLQAFRGGLFDEAFENFKQSSPFKVDACCGSIPAQARKNGNMANYKELFQKNKESLVELTDHLLKLGSEFESRGEIDKAIDCFGESIQIGLYLKRLEKGARYNLQLANSFEKRGDAYLEKRNFDEAFTCFQQSLNLKKQFNQEMGGMQSDVGHIQRKLDEVRSKRSKPSDGYFLEKRVFKFFTEKCQLLFYSLKKIIHSFSELFLGLFLSKRNRA